MAERKSLLPPSPRGNASKGGLHSVPPPPVRGAVSPSHRHRVRAVGFRPRARGVFGAPQPAQEGKMFRPRARGVFSQAALRLPARLCPVPVRNIRRWRGTSKSSAFCPAPVRDNVLFSPRHRTAGRAAASLPCPAHFQPPCRTRSPARPPLRGASASPSFSLTIPAPGGYNARVAAGTYSSAG